MTNEQLEAMREWVRAEIAYAIAYSTTDEEGYHGSCRREEKEADQAFEKLKSTLQSPH